MIDDGYIEARKEFSPTKYGAIRRKSFGYIPRGYAPSRFARLACIFQRRNATRIRFGLRHNHLGAGLACQPQVAPYAKR
ncbi:MAG: hypothetical protein IJB34_00775 [Clostridia bacterium]|nr:hypothetical protein [Clostridia bacterium]